MMVSPERAATCGAASAESVESPIAGLPAASAMPRAAEIPTRKPVKLPGPTVTAMRLSSLNSERAASMTRAINGMTASACPRIMPMDSAARIAPACESSTAAARPAIGLSTLSALAAPHVAARTGDTIIAAIDARNEQVYFQVFAPNGVTVVTPRLDRVRAAVRAVPVGPTVITGSGALLVAAHWPSGSPVPRVEDHAAPDIGWVARLGAAAQEEGAPPKPLYLRRPDARPQDAGRLPRR